MTTPAPQETAQQKVIKARNTRSRPAPLPDVDCTTCKFGEQCRPLAYIPPCYNHGPDSPARAAAQAREKELCELLYYINPDSRAGVVIIERLKSLRTEAQP